jgi:hypothetical protein
MATYVYRCPEHRKTAIEVTAPIGKAPTTIVCPVHRCGTASPRDMGAEFETQYVKNDDPFRKAWLSDGMTHELAKQKRPLDPLAPKDKHEAKHVAKATGRIYIGDDVSKLSERGRNAVIKHGGLKV